MDYADYQHLAFERRPNGVVLVTINRPRPFGSMASWPVTKTKGPASTAWL